MKFSTCIVRKGISKHYKESFRSCRELSTSMAILSPEYKPMATALSDFFSPSPFEIQKTRKLSSMELNSEYQPRATALSDFMAPTKMEQAQSKMNLNGTQWSRSLSFASPESDFTSASDIILESSREESLLQQQDSQQVLDYSSNADIEILNNVVDTHLQEAAMDIREETFYDDEFRSSVPYSLSFASAESDWTSNFMSPVMKDQLEYVEKNGPIYKTYPLHLQKNEEKKSISSPLPKSFDEETIKFSRDALVVTEKAAPFRIVTVNPAWEQLCGFSKEESVGKTLSMLQGPETDNAAVTAVIAQMLKGEEAGTEIINYDKSGRKFHNRLSLGSLRSPVTNEITHFVGLLKEVNLSQQKISTTN